MIKTEKSNALKYRLLLSSIAFCISFFLCFLYVDNTIGYCGDDVQIIHQAIVALNGNVQEFINDYSYMNANNVAPIATNAYSWGTSFLLVPIYKIFGLENIMMLKMVMILSFSTFIFIFSMYLSQKTNFLISSIITVFISTCPYFINFSNEIMKDIPFLLISFIFVLAVDNFLKEKQFSKQIFYSLFVSLMLTLCVLFRENGGLMIIVLLISQIIKIFHLQKNGEKISRSIWLSFFLPYLITAATYYSVSYKYPTFYTTEYVDCSLISIAKMSLYYLNQMRIEIFNFGNLLSSIAFIVTLILFVIGLTKKYKEEYVAVIMLCTFVFYTACPLKQGIRYILPLIPFIFLFVGFSGLNFIKSRLKLFILFFLFLVICNVTVLSKMNLLSKIQDRDINYGINSTSAKELYSYIIKNTSNDSKIIYWHPRAIYLYTGRQSFQISEEKEKLKNADYQVSIIGNDRPASSYDIEMYDYNKKTYIPEAEINLNPVYRNENFVMYKIEKI